MSLDVWLTVNQPVVVFDGNITHNLVPMAREAGLYEALWRPEELNVSVAGGLVDRLELGLEKLKADPERFQKLNPENGWGNYENLVGFVEKYLEACKENRTAKVGVCR